MTDPIFHRGADEARRQQQAWAERARLLVVGTDKILFADAVMRCGALR